jgi:hypothetical protein
MRAAGINFADIMQRRGHYQGGPEPPYRSCWCHKRGAQRLAPWGSTLVGSSSLTVTSAFWAARVVGWPTAIPMFKDERDGHRSTASCPAL